LNFIEKIIRMYRRIDVRIAELSKLHAARLKCRETCCTCCVDDLTVFEVEADVVRHHYPELLETGIPHPEGECAFLDDNGCCRIYAHRPYVCRTQGLPLRWIGEGEGESGDPEMFEYRDICPLNEEGVPIELLDEEACWTLGPAEGEMAAMQQEIDGGRMCRVSLRALFVLKAGSEKACP